MELREKVGFLGVNGNNTCWVEGGGLYAILGNSSEMHNAQKRFLLYRWHVADAVYFDSSFKMTLDNLGWTGPRYDDYTSVAYWYLDKPSACPFSLPSDQELVMR